MSIILKIRKVNHYSLQEMVLNMFKLKFVLIKSIYQAKNLRVVKKIMKWPILKWKQFIRKFISNFSANFLINYTIAAECPQLIVQFKQTRQKMKRAKHGQRSVANMFILTIFCCFSYVFLSVSVCVRALARVYLLQWLSFSSHHFSSLIF